MKDWLAPWPSLAAKAVRARLESVERYLVPEKRSDRVRSLPLLRSKVRLSVSVVGDAADTAATEIWKRNET